MPATTIPKRLTLPPTRIIKETSYKPCGYRCGVCGKIFSPYTYECPECGADTGKKSRDDQANKLKLEEQELKAIDRKRRKMEIFLANI